VSSIELTVSADPLYEGRLVPGPVEGYLVRNGQYYMHTVYMKK